MSQLSLESSSCSHFTNAVTVNLRTGPQDYSPLLKLSVPAKSSRTFSGFWTYDQHRYLAWVAGMVDGGFDWGEHLNDLKFGYCHGMAWLHRDFCCGSTAAVDLIGNRCFPGTTSMLVHQIPPANSFSSRLSTVDPDPNIMFPISEGTRLVTSGLATWTSWSVKIGIMKWTFIVDYVLYVAVGVGLAVVSSFICCRLAFAACGSGIPEIKTILGGFTLPHVLSPWTLLTKGITLAMAVGSGLGLGKEGPMVHMGACWAGLICNLVTNIHPSKKAALISAGSAAGVSTAFGTPVGGVLFALEEVSTYFPAATLYKTLTCCVIASLVLKKFNFGSPGQNGTIFQLDAIAIQGRWEIVELVPFIILAALGGLTGSIFIRLNVFISRQRISLRRSQPPVLPSFFRENRCRDKCTSVETSDEKYTPLMLQEKCQAVDFQSTDHVYYATPARFKCQVPWRMTPDLFSDFYSKQTHSDNHSPGSSTISSLGDNSEPALSPTSRRSSSDVAWAKTENSNLWANVKMWNHKLACKIVRIPVLEVLVFATLANSINYNLSMLRYSPTVLMKHMFTRCGNTGIGPFTDIFGLCSPKGDFHDSSNQMMLQIGISLVAYFFNALFTLGLALPSGLFVPCLTIGSLIGRLIGLMTIRMDNQFEFMGCKSCVHPGVYSLLGAVAVLAGVTRMTVSMVVIAVEMTGGLGYIVPFMLVCLISRWTAASLEESSIYDNHIHLKRLPFLHLTPQKADHNAAQGRCAADIMSRSIVCISLTRQWTINMATDLVKEYQFSTYPVVDDDESGVLYGTVNRRKLTKRLNEFAKHSRSRERADIPITFAPHGYNEDIIDCSDLVDRVVVQINSYTPLLDVHHLFLNLGMGHLLFTEKGVLKGILTKKALLSTLGRLRGDL